MEKFCGWKSGTMEVYSFGSIYVYGPSWLPVPTTIHRCSGQSPLLAFENKPEIAFIEIEVSKLPINIQEVLFLAFTS